MAQEKREHAGLLRNLLRNTGGNVLAITAAATLPMLGVIGGAVDISRLYLVKSRVQAACDSAVLAGRKAMTTMTYTDPAKARARSMFNVNFQDADYGTSGTVFDTSANNQGVVSGTVTTTVPMVLMNIFGVAPTSVTVACSADIQIPNIDIVFVLDVTGSMDECPDGNCNNNPAGEVRKITALRTAVNNFYTTLATAMVGNTVSRVRYGFVPYSQTVNGLDLFSATPDATIGQLPLTHLRSTMEVQSRLANFNTFTRWKRDPNTPPTFITQKFKNNADTKSPFVATTGTGTEISENDCNWYSANQAFNISSGDVDVKLYPRLSQSWPGEGNGDSVLYQPEGSSGTAGWQTAEPTTGNSMNKMTFAFESRGGNGNTEECTRRVITTRHIRQDGYKFTDWRYQPVNYNVTNFRASTPLNYVTAIDPEYTVTTSGRYDPVTMAGWADQIGLTSVPTTWDGCLEERDTTAAATFAPIPAAALDLNVLDGGTTDPLRWRPILRELTYNRGQPANEDNSAELGKPGYTCPTARMRNLNVMTQQQFNDYVATLQPGGSTYLDVGMVWGLRLISAQGMFASRNLIGPNGGQISRHIIFLTDGELAPSSDTYSAYGVERMAQRIAGGSTNPDARARHAARFQALCDLQRGGVSIWAIAFGTSVGSNLTACADPGRAKEADNPAELEAAFRTIAQDISDLRLIQ